MALTWSDSSNKHEIAREDAIHAIAHALYVEPEFDESRVPSGVRPTLYIGPPRALGGPLLEVMAEVTPPCEIHVFHVMLARAKMLERMPQ